MSTQPSSNPTQGGSRAVINTANPAARPIPLVASIQRRIAEIKFLLQGLEAEVASLTLEPVRVHRALPTAQQIVGAVCRQLQVNPNLLYVKSNARQCTAPRKMAQFLMRKHTRMSLPTIAAHFEQHHSTVIYAVEQFKGILAADRQIEEQVQLIEQSLGLQEMTH